MPLGALLMSVMVGWEIRPKSLLEEIHHGNSSKWINAFFSASMMVVVPAVMAFILAGQMGDYFTTDPESKTVYYIGYAICGVILALAWIAAITSPQRRDGK